MAARGVALRDHGTLPRAPAEEPTPHAIDLATLGPSGSVMDGLNAALALAAGTVLVLGLISGYVKNRLWISEPLIALLVGFLVGPSLLGLVALDLSQEAQNAVLREVARVTLALSVMGAALRLPHAYELRHWRELLVVLGLGMPLMWLASSALVYLVLGVPLLLALLIGAVLTPTDPVLSDSIVTGRLANETVPGRLRHAISAESGANDGLALMLVMLPVALLTRSVEAALGHWALDTLLQHLIGGVAIGLAIGWAAGRCLRWAYRQPFSERTSILGSAIALALTVLAIDRLLSTAAVLAVFVAGLAFNRVIARREDAWHEHIQEAIGRFFDIPIFIFFGAVLPWQAWLDLGWTGPALAALVLLLRRLPAWFLLRPLLPSVRSWRESLFTGWFGPIGIAGLFYATDVHHQVAHGETVWTVASLVVLGSILVHGATATPFTRLYGRRAGAAERS
jgi:NhaP-type Na+/H+ or K+/H+ antiporter